MKIRFYLLIAIATVAPLPIWWIWRESGQSGSLMSSLSKYQVVADPIDRTARILPLVAQQTVLPTSNSDGEHPVVPMTRRKPIRKLPKQPRAKDEPFQYPPVTKCSVESNRNFQKHPVLVMGNGYPDRANMFHTLRCDVPCLYSSDFGSYKFAADASLIGGLTCPNQRFAMFTMENQEVHKDEKTYSMTVSAKSDVPVPYYSWSDFPIMAPLANKTHPAMASAFVSNCVPARREVIETLVKEGITLHSFGACVHNQDESNISKLAGKYERKIDIMSKYKFHLAFENSIAEDYVTEKFFQALVAGTIPVVYGAPNIHMFEPANNSILAVADFPSIAALAARMKEINRDPALFESMLAWKRTGLSDQFKAMMDFTTVHSECRLCIRIADEHARTHGEFHNSTLPGLQRRDSTSFHLLVRERHAYYFRYVYPAEKTIAALHKAIADIFEEADYIPLWSRSREFDGVLRVYSVYRAYATMAEARTTARLLSDRDVAGLLDGARLEVVFV